jgi:hypothetical protein
MRTISLCLLTLTMAASAAAPANAPELEKLRASYKAAVAKVAKSILQTHIATLEKLRDIYARGSNLTAATKVQADIDRANVAMTTGEFIPPAADANVLAPELDKLRTGHEADIERAIKPYRETYVRELDKLRDNYTRAANLAAATAVQAEIDGAKPDAAGTSKLTAVELRAAGKQPHLSGKAPKSEWFVGKTWVNSSGTAWIFAKGGKGEVHHTTGKIAPMTWDVMPSGVLKLRHEASTSANISSMYVYLTSAKDGLSGLEEDRLIKPMHPK